MGASFSRRNAAISYTDQDEVVIGARQTYLVLSADNISQARILLAELLIVLLGAGKLFGVLLPQSGENLDGSRGFITRFLQRFLNGFLHNVRGGLRGGLHFCAGGHAHHRRRGRLLTCHVDRAVCRRQCQRVRDAEN